MIRVGIHGATGYTGFELVKILARHPEAQVAFATSESYAGQSFAEVYPCPYDIPLIKPEQAPLDQADVVLLCTPHGASAKLACDALAAGARCVDLSADLRLHDLAVYETWYGRHTAPQLLPEAVYGLTEVYRAQVAGARLVANPGCYPTGNLLALRPLLQAGIVTSDRIIIDAKSGVSGAGAKPSPKTHFCNVHDNLAAYNVGHTHRHVPEIEQELSSFAGHSVRVVFSPHLLPVSRGILSSIYVSVDPAWDETAVRRLLQDAYRGEPFVQVLNAGDMASLAHVVNTNRCALSVSSAGVPGEFVLFAAIDNLLKGASGQAMQNVNCLFGLDETLGLI
ncbi:MAG: N-acetyl-gamma-glutamyl-phosphate reductase [Anaerolineae bacterium]